MLNGDSSCFGILIQLPLPERLRPYQQILSDMIEVKKDIDCMTSEMIGKISVARSDVVYPAAVSATIELLSFNKLNNLKGKQVSIIGQSNLIGKPLALYCINQ
jgi:methylenetetrahydrofolate dehydrogenase (NADP+)/methenyltetrahydrofolate cyclohydrolase